MIMMEIASMREQSRVHSGSGSAFGLCVRATDATSKHPPEVVKNKYLNLLRWPHERLVERAVLRR